MRTNIIHPVVREEIQMTGKIFEPERVRPVFEDWRAKQ